MKERLVKPADIPCSLWDQENDVIILPHALADAYVKLIKEHDLCELATERDMNDPPVGGLDKERTDKHFAQAFDGSCARAELAVLDPKNQVPQASNAFVSILAGNNVSITDAPCGAGAAAFSFLTTIAALRSQKILPREPLYVNLIGAELSEPARGYANKMLTALTHDLAAQAIFVEAEWLEWDVTCDRSNTNLIQKMTHASKKNSARLVVIANFNAFLEKERKRNEAESRLRELFRHAAGKNSMVIWIEPAMKRATDNLFPWLRNLLNGLWKSFARESANFEKNDPLAVSFARFQLPLLSNSTARVGLAVMAIELKWE